MVEHHTWGPPLGHMPLWGENGYESELVPLCAAVRQATDEDKQEWQTIRRKRSENVIREMPTMVTNRNYNSGNKFNDLESTMYDEKDYPALDFTTSTDTKRQAAQKMLKAPKKKSQAERKNEKKNKGIDDGIASEGGSLLCVVSTNNTEAFRERAKSIRESCERERPSTCQRGNDYCHRQLYCERPICAMPSSNPWQSHLPEWQYLALTVDSGAAETVIPHMLVEDHPIRETNASRSGLNYASATGDPIPNLGEQRLPLMTQEGSLRAMTFQAAPVDRALGSVKRMCSSGHTIVFDDDGSYVLNKLTGEVNWMR